MGNTNKNKRNTPKFRGEYFLRLFRTNEDRLFGFILNLLLNSTIAEDIIQEKDKILINQRFPTPFKAVFE